MRALLLKVPLSPYGFGGTQGLTGEPTTVDHAGTGGGGVNPDFVKRLAAGDRSADDPSSPPFPAISEKETLPAAA